MNPLTSLLQRAKIGQAETILIPYVYIRGESWDGKSGVLPVMLQYDSEDVGNRLASASIENYTNAKMLEVTHNGEKIILYLVRAQKNSTEDVRIEIPFANGTLWGWFPKQFAQ